MRKKSKSKKTPENSLRILIFFCLAVAMAILLSLSYRLFLLVQASKFDSKHAFVIGFFYKNDLDIVAIYPEQKQLSHLQIRGGKSKDETKINSGIVVDTEVTLGQPFQLSKVSDYLSDAVVHRHQLRSDLNAYDLYRLSFMMKHIAQNTITTESLHIPYDESVSQNMLEELFLDQSIDQENKTVAIINGAGIPGLGSKLEKELAVIGVNVISVTNADSVKSSSEMIYSGDATYTVKRLERLLAIPAKQSPTQDLSDILIIIGRDIGSERKF